MKQSAKDKTASSSRGAAVRKTSKRAVVPVADNGDDDGAPEEIQQSSVQIQELRQLHEAMVAPAVTRKRVKKSITEKVDADKKLDSSLLEGLNDEDFQLGVDEEEEEDEEAPVAKRRRKIDTSSRSSKKFGNVLVTSLSTENALDAFIKSAKNGKTKSTLELIGSTQPRTRFAVFAAQKKRGPAKVFA